MNTIIGGGGRYSTAAEQAGMTVEYRNSVSTYRNTNKSTKQSRNVCFRAA